MTVPPRAPETPEALVDPIGTVVAVVTSIDPCLDQDDVHRVVARVGGGRAKRRRLATTLARDASAFDQRALTGSSGRRGPPPRAPRRRGEQDLAAVVHQLRAGAVGDAAARPGLVLRAVLHTSAGLRSVRRTTTSHLPRPTGAATVLPVPRPRRPRPAPGPGQAHHRDRSRAQRRRGDHRDHRHRQQARARPEAGVGPRGRARAAHRGWGESALPHGASADRRSP